MVRKLNPPKRKAPTICRPGYVSPTPITLEPRPYESVVFPKGILAGRMALQYNVEVPTDTSHIMLPSAVLDTYEETAVDSSPQEEPCHISYPQRWSNLYESKQSFFINKLTPWKGVPSETRRWIRNASDERAAQEGMRVSEERGQYVVNWVQNHCVLYEGSRAGEYIDIDDWQYEFFMQLFGWLVQNEELAERRKLDTCWIRRFTQASIWIAKKNAKSPTLAATGLYTLCGDGEKGNKCYSVARDGNQALISHTHAMMMVEYSPELSSVCTIKKTNYSITHNPTNSVYTL